MSKLDLVNIIIENEWYSKTLSFIAKAYNIDKETLTHYINGNKPEVSEEKIKTYLDKVDEILAKEEVEKNEEKE